MKSQITPQNDPTIIEVRVTRDMIHWALRQTSTQCAAALAIRDADPDGEYVFPHVDQEKISFTDRRTEQRYTWTDVPKKLASWIDQFDRDPSKCRPFSFTLDTNQAEVKPVRHLTLKQKIEQAKQKREKVVRDTQRKIPVALQEIKHTSKRELRNVEVPEGAGEM